MADQRVAWVDYAKGFCIIMVVMMHSTLGVEKAAGTDGWMHYLVAFARPFRMPDFFMISGLFLARVIDRDWRTYLDKKVVHFAYFYVLWLIIQFGLKTPGLVASEGPAETGRQFALAFIEPFGTMWFIYLLPIFFVVTKATRGIPWWVIWLAGAALESAHVSTGWTIIDEFAQRFVYFYSGYVFSRALFRYTDVVTARPWIAGAYLGVWAAINGLAVSADVSEVPGISLFLGFTGAAAVMTFATLMSVSGWMAPVRYCGEHSIVIYLAFFLPMAAMRALLLRWGSLTDIGSLSLIVTAAGVIGPLVLYWIVRGTPARFLFERPAWARLRSPSARLVPAE
jgi:uncharacterized membrane protein YcfT